MYRVSKTTEILTTESFIRISNNHTRACVCVRDREREYESERREGRGREREQKNQKSSKNKFTENFATIFSKDCHNSFYPVML